jgi:hypothetical protein
VADWQEEASELALLFLLEGFAFGEEGLSVWPEAVRLIWEWPREVAVSF